jgi:hypothetical protein
LGLAKAMARKSTSKSSQADAYRAGIALVAQGMAGSGAALAGLALRLVTSSSDSEEGLARARAAFTYMKTQPDLEQVAQIDKAANGSWWYPLDKCDQLGNKVAILASVSQGHSVAETAREAIRYIGDQSRPDRLLRASQRVVEVVDELRTPEARRNQELGEASFTAKPYTLDWRIYRPRNRAALVQLFVGSSDSLHARIAALHAVASSDPSILCDKKALGVLHREAVEKADAVAPALDFASKSLGQRDYPLLAVDILDVIRTGQADGHPGMLARLALKGGDYGYLAPNIFAARTGPALADSATDPSWKTAYQFLCGVGWRDNTAEILRLMGDYKGEFPLLVVCGQLAGLSGEGLRKALLTAQESAHSLHEHRVLAQAREVLIEQGPEAALKLIRQGAQEGSDG